VGPDLPSAGTRAAPTTYHRLTPGATAECQRLPSASIRSMAA